MLGLVLAAMPAGCAATKAVVPPVSPSADGSHIPGKFVWLDLVTGDLGAAKKFYGEMFGWTFDPVEGVDNYVIVLHEGQPIGGILETERADGEKGGQWLAYVSVADVDDAVRRFEDDGGKLHRGPLDIPGRGRAALVSDAQGAYLALLRSSSGDPPDGRLPGEGRFMWIDYVANDVERAFSFYGGLFAWSHELRDAVGEREYHVFSQAGRPRAGLFKNPWPNVKPNWLPYVRVADTAAMTARARELGATVIVEPRSELRGGSVAVVLDPSGAALVLQQYPLPDAGGTKS